MELRKNPKLDIHQYSNLIFNLSLIVVLLAFNTAFEWKVYDNEGLIDVFEMEASESKGNFEKKSDVKIELPKPQTKPIEKPEIEQKNEAEEEEIIIKVRLDVSLEGKGFDNSFLNNMIG